MPMFAFLPRTLLWLKELEKSMIGMNANFIRKLHIMHCIVTMGLSASSARL